MKTEPNESLFDAFWFLLHNRPRMLWNSNGIEAFKTGWSKAIKPDPKIVFVLLIVRLGVVQFLRTRYAIWLFNAHIVAFTNHASQQIQIGKEMKNTYTTLGNTSIIMPGKENQNEQRKKNGSFLSMPVRYVWICMCVSHFVERDLFEHLSIDCELPTEVRNTLDQVAVFCRINHVLCVVLCVSLISFIWCD